MSDSARLGGGYASSSPDPRPTAQALLASVSSGDPSARLVVLAGPPGVGKSSVAKALVRLMPETLLIDKDHTAGGFVLEAAHLRGDGPEAAYGAKHYWQKLRPLEYAGPLRLACDNLVGHRQVLLVGGWGPELGMDDLWNEIHQRLSPSRLIVLHLDPPEGRSGGRAWPNADPAATRPISSNWPRIRAIYLCGAEPCAFRAPVRWQRSPNARSGR